MNKRDFLKLAGLGGLAAAGTGAARAAEMEKEAARMAEMARRVRKPVYNMCGHAAGKLDTVGIAFVGVGARGIGAVRRMAKISNVRIAAVADIQEKKTGLAEKALAKTSHRPVVYAGTEDGWKEAVAREDVDLVYICTPWALHAPMAVAAMEAGKHVAVEIPAALTLEECWELVETSERTRRHCVMLENCCYGFFELLTLNMARQKYFGEVVHVEGAYIHDVFESLFNKSRRHDLWRLRENERNGNLYPTHGLGPVSQILDINRGDQYDHLVSMSSDDFMIGKRVAALAEGDAEFRQFRGKAFRGNMNTTMIRTKKGRTVMLQHDVTSPRPYSRIHLVSGTEGCAQQFPLPGRIAKGHEWLGEEEVKLLEKQYEPEIVKRMGALAKKVGGHGGMDFLMDWRLIDCLRNGLPMDMDVYDAAAWSAVLPLSGWSVANRSGAVDFPDFTGGAWRTNAPVDISMARGGNTGVVGG
ncbi:Gfo/Idh/MocA family oxidoreductase [Luteolibacter sp. SL250]|uniref:Gfo/Idh/MocA family protein n=1 Tax=Luteolibacter sp. SL250 TaxID=2995170 RepID=UPI002271EAC5|nr:Gfo/Idh/MocA family oxidoreductase [Luteolibacter sp. SL250]WAC18793.1 Gfo/Idh/MocA family oxidoreductase [Luteolibacter sp. SL250]